MEKLALVGEQALKKAGVDFKVDPKSISEILGENIKERNDEKKPTAENLAKELSALGAGGILEVKNILNLAFEQANLKSEEQRADFALQVANELKALLPDGDWKEFDSVINRNHTLSESFLVKTIVKAIRSTYKATSREEAPEAEESVVNEAETYQPLVEIFKDVEVTEIKTAIGQVVFYTNKGIGYKDHNEDRIVINTEKNGFAVIDGMGGMGNGEEAAEILAEQIQKGFLNNTSYEQVQELAYVEMFNKGVGRGGACYVSARVDQEGIMHGAMAGDVRLIVVNIKGEVVFETKDEGAGPGVYNVVQGTEPGKTTKFSYKLEKGYKVLIFSDGVSDNFDEAEDDFKEKKQGSQNIADFLNGKTLKEAVEELKSRQEEKVTIFTNKKKELKELFNLKSVSQKNINDYNDEVAKLDGKPDNVALVAFEYSGEGNTAETKERAYEWNAEVMDALDQKKHPVILEYKEMLFGDFAKSLESPNIVLNTEKARDAFLLWWEAGGKYNEINAMKEEGLLEDWQEFLNSPGVNKE